MHSSRRGNKRGTMNEVQDERSGLDTTSASLHFTTMRKRALILAAMILALCGTGAAASEQARLAQFLAGCEVIGSSLVTDHALTAAALHWLVKHTGITPQRAHTLIDRYRNRPDEWGKVLQLMRAELDDPPPQPVTKK
jgi:hypothetical protein